MIFDLGFSSLKEYQKNLPKLSNQELIDEFNLFYVSLTRARKVLVKDSENFHYLMSSKLNQLIDKKIEESKDNFEKDDKKQVVSKMSKEELEEIKEQKNLEKGKAKKSGLKWSLEDKIKLKSMFKKDITINQISSKLERSSTAIIGELFKSETINKEDQITLLKLIKANKKASKSVL